MLLLALSAVLAAVTPAASSAGQGLVTAAASSQSAILNTYCVTCHSDKAKTGGLSLERADVVSLRYAARINGFDAIALTKLDVLDTCDTVKVCVGYRYGGEVLTDFPEEERISSRAMGWTCSAR